jgi:hypothetical protein
MPASISRPRLAGDPGREPLRVRALSRLHAGSLDAQIRAGRPLDDSPELAARAQHLTAPRARKAVADGLCGAALRAVALPGAVISTRMPINCDAAHTAFRSLAELSERLRDDAAPARAQGVALASLLLTDASSPLYEPAETGELRAAVLVALDACDRRVGAPT